jgi:hypothetical protein
MPPDLGRHIVESSFERRAAASFPPPPSTPYTPRRLPATPHHVTTAADAAATLTDPRIKENQRIDRRPDETYIINSLLASDRYSLFLLFHRATSTHDIAY